MPTLRVLGEANTMQAQKQFAALTAQVEALNVAMAKTALVPQGGSPAGFAKTTAALSAAGHAYNQALASSGAFRVETLKVNDVIAQQTDLLRRQKLGFKDVWGSEASRKRMQLIRKEQAAMRNMTIRAVQGGIGDGHLRASLAIPKDVSQSWDTLRSRVGMFGHELSSVSRTMLNWGKNTQWAGRQLMAGITYPMAAFGAAAGVMAYKVDKQLTRIQKVYNTTSDQFSKNTEESSAAMAELSQLAVDGFKTASDAARQYGVSVTDTLAVQAELAATGQKGQKLQKATTEVMKSAMLGEIDYQTATKATIGLQQTLNLSSQELAETWAYMNSVENQTSLSMADFATAIPIALGPLKQMGGTVQDLGTLLTAMVSRGVQVGKAANAIKATAQRLLRPSKQIQEEFKAITGADIIDIAARNKGNILGMMQELYTVTKQLSDYDKSKAFAGLFGSYQLATMSAMVDGMGDLEQGIGQTTTAYEVGTQSAEEWGKVQQREIKAIQDSASGKFRIALETLKASLAEVGKPFLAVASGFLKATTIILDFFNALPSKVKTGLMIAGIFVALAGPALMLAGLFINLISNVGLFAGALLKMVGNFNLFNKAEWAQMKLDALYEKQLYSTTTAIELQTMEVKALTMAMQAHNAEMMRSAGFSAAAKAQFLGMPGMGAPATPNQNAQSAYMQTMYNSGTKRYHDPATGNMIKTAEAQQRAAAATAAQIAASQGLQTRAASENLRIQEKTQKVASGTNVAMGAMAASMLLMTTNSSETAHNMGQWLLILSLGVPLLKGAAIASAAVAAKGLAAAKAANASRAATVANYGAASRTSRVLGKSLAASKGMGAAMMAMMGPVGWIGAALATAGFVTYKIWQHNKEITKQKREQANAMYDQNNLLEDQLKIQAKAKETLDISGIGYSASGLPTPSELAADMKKDDTYKALIENLKDDDVSATEKRAVALTKYRDVLQATGGTAQKATLYLEALFQAAGDGALEAQRKANEFAQELGSDFGDMDLAGLWESQIQSIFNDTDTESIKEQGKNLGKDLASSIVEGGRENANQNLGEFVNIYGKQVQAEFSKLSVETQAMFKDVGIGAEEIGSIIETWTNGDVGDIDNLMDNLGFKQGSIEAMEFEQVMNDLVSASNSPFKKLGDMQSGIVEELRNQLGIEQEINSMKELQATWEWQLATATAKTSRNIVQKRIAEIESMKAQVGNLVIAAKLSDEQKIALVNQVRLNAGQDALKSIYQVNAFLAGTIFDETEKTVGAVQRLKSAWDAVTFSDDNMKDILKSGMEGVTSDLADAASENFDNRMNNSIDAAQRGWDSRIDAMNERHENAMDAFDARWERRKDAVTAAYDAQIAGIDKAIEREEKAEEIRQRIFDAEMTRIERMKDIQNANIDYNMALRTGNIDEAAKIQNDMMAQAQSWALGDAAAAGANRSKKKIDALGARKDDIEQAKDDRIEAMEAIEEKQREHLQKMQEQEEKSLQQRSDNAMDALRDQWEFEKRNYNQKLDLFKSYTAMNKKDLDRWLAEVGLSYDDFGGSVMLKGETWSGAIEKSLKQHIRAAGMEIANSQLWENLGAKEAKATLMGMGFKGMGQFKKFIMTGEMPKGFGKKRDNQTGYNPAANHPVAPPGETLHSGGMVGAGINNRTGVARGVGGLHPSEVMVRAQKGEMMMNRGAASKYGDTLALMNKGQFSGGPTGVAGYVGALAAKGLATGVGKAFENYANRRAVQSVASSVLGAFTGSAVGVNASSFVEGPGGPHTAADPGKGWVNSHDYQNPLNSPLYAFNDAKVIESRAVTSGGSPGNGIYPTPYRSYGETLLLEDAQGNRVRYAHLNPGARYVKAGDVVKGGSLIGRSGQTGNASGPHTHFDVNGSELAQGWFEAHHIGLKKGGYVKKDTPATVHKNEMTIDAKRTKKMYALVDNFTGLDGFWNWMSGSQQLGPNGLPATGNLKKDRKVGNAAAAATSGKGEVVRTGTYNISWRSDPSTTPPALKTLMQLADVLSLQEVYGSRVGLVQKTLADGGWGMGAYKDDSVVAYNKAKYNLLGSGNRGMNPNKNDGGVHRNRNAAWALLKGAGQAFYQLSAHTNPMFGQMKAGGRNYDIQREQYGTLTDMVREFSKKAPVILGGDLNWELERPGGIPIADLTSVMAGHPGGINGLHTHAGGGDVDHIMFGPGAKNIKTRILGGLPSDHNAILSEIAIPQLRKGAQNIRWDNTLANLHKGESVLTQDITSKFKDGVDNFANGGENQYTTNVYVNGSNASAEEIALAVDRVHRRRANRLPKKVSNR